MSSASMPSPYAEDAPKFHYDKPEELNRFIRQVEELFEKFGVKTDTDKIKYLGAYADARSEREWQGMSSHTAGNFSDFKKEIIASYPEASEEIRGSLRGLRKIVDKYSQISPADLTQLQAFRRAFSAEAIKLQYEPPLLSNLEMVNCFMEPLTEAFRKRILDKLDLATMVKPASSRDRRAEDRFSFDEIMEAAISIARSPETSYSLDGDILLEIEPSKNARTLMRAREGCLDDGFY
jgi:hypothetical protein